MREVSAGTDLPSDRRRTQTGESHRKVCKNGHEGDRSIVNRHEYRNFREIVSRQDEDPQNNPSEFELRSISTCISLIFSKAMIRASASSSFLPRPKRPPKNSLPRSPVFRSWNLHSCRSRMALADRPASARMT
ncbi:hypothetical protein FGO68_gene14620 [Halteria grandinella]|uniref:Uncharacterized protein n=1 Tax=Halteria grandinella TaxID=5974 RepID=A0A8J8NHZ5_HALGN|nr:hypothetical protein FGO68_gene14620 [Halteria grandinella]